MANLNATIAESSDTSAPIAANLVAVADEIVRTALETAGKVPGGRPLVDIPAGSLVLRHIVHVLLTPGLQALGIEVMW